MKYLAPFVLATGGLGLMAYFLVAGSYVDESGLVVEEFWAWGLGVILVSVALILSGLIWLISRIRSVG